MSVRTPEEVKPKEEWPEDAPVSYEAWCVACRVLAREEVGGPDREAMDPIVVWPVGYRDQTGIPIAVLADEILKEADK